MRMWMTDVTKMCRRHLLGEHVEHHMFVGSLHKDLTGYVANGLLQASSLTQRHDEIAAEMARRGYNHRSPLPQYQVPPELTTSTVDPVRSTQDLTTRCSECAALHGVQT